MRRERVPRYVGLDARTAAELAEKLTAKMEELKAKSPEVIWNLSNGNSAFLLYYEDELIPEDLVDELELKGVIYTCGECHHKVPVTDGRRRFRYTCDRKFPGTNPEDRACRWFYAEMEGGGE